MGIHHFLGLAAAVTELGPELVAVAGRSARPVRQGHLHRRIRGPVDDHVAGAFQVIGVDLDVAGEQQACAAVEAMVPGIRPVPFGHVGDGNVHFNLTQPAGASPADYLARWEEVNRRVHDIALALGGSISAEHGIGRAKLAENLRSKAPLEIELMARVKAALDPANLMNPGKVVPAPAADDGREG